MLDPKTVSFESNGGSGVESQTVFKNYPVKRPSDPVRDGYTFDTWYIDNDTFVEQWDFNTIPAVGFTLYAKWNISGELTIGTLGLVYELINNDTAYRVSRGSAEGNIVIPAYHRPNPDSPYLPVTEIGNGIDTMYDNAFGQTSIPNTTVTSVTVTGSQLTAISNYAFQGCHSLTRITLPASVKSIGDSAFGDCSELTAIAIPAGVESIGSAAFNNCVKLTGITLPAGITSISTGTFAFCSELTSINIPANVTSIAANAFNQCEKLASITILANVTSIAANAFAGCTSLRNITIDNTVYPTDTSSNWGTIFPATGLSVTFRKNVGGAAFYACYRLTSVTIAEGVTYIGGSAFQSTSITSISIPASVASIDGAAFDDCASLTSVTFNGTITSGSFATNAFSGDLRYEYLAGGAGTYIRASGDTAWALQ